MLAVTACASAATLLLYSTYSLQLHLYIVHGNKNCSNCAFLYNCKVLNPPTRETVTTYKPQIHAAKCPGAFRQYVMTNIFWGRADDKKPIEILLLFLQYKATTPSTVTVHMFLLEIPSIPLRAEQCMCFYIVQSKVTPLLTYFCPLEKWEKQLPNANTATHYLPMHLL